MRFFIFLYIWLTQLTTYSQNINIRIYSNVEIQSIYFTAKQGKYDFISNNKLICSIEEGETVTITRKDNVIRIWNNQLHESADTLLLVRGTQQTNFFTITSPTKSFQERAFDNDLYVSLKNKALVLINDVNFDKYIAGVVEAEGGSKAPTEYYKAQAVLCRTYAAKFYEKHLPEGFNLCDGVHCQAYKGRCKYNLDILDAATSTSGLIIVDSTSKIADATFYANSGGQTVNSEDLWTLSHYYLRSKPDPYSIGQHGYEWEKTIPLESWKTYLTNKGFQINDSLGYNYSQPNRTRYFNYNGNDSLLELKTIRTDFQLRSTFFNAEQQGESIVLKGKGYGHGVGLSQEGAMEMARQNFTYDKIIKFYFTGVQLMNMTNVKFFEIDDNSIGD